MGARYFFLLVTITLVWHFSQATPKCPPVMPYVNCTCDEETFSVKCTNESTFGNTLPVDLPDSIVMTFIGHNFEFINHIPYPNLNALHLDNNNIKVINNFAFRNLSNLATLSIANNPISLLTPRTFRGLVRLEVLTMENTQLFKIDNYVFVGKHLPKLEIVKLANCSIYDIKPHAFHMLENLALLNLSNNNLKLVPEFASTDFLGELSHLDLSKNGITSLGQSGFENLPNLQNLFLSHNKIHKIYNHDFKGLDKTLVTLDLDHNHLNETGPTAFIRLTSLASLDISNNDLKQLIWEEFPWDNLVKVLLHDNPWTCDCENSWMIESETIKVHNKHSNFTCAAPHKYQNKPVLEVPPSAFACPPRTHKWTTTVVLVMGVAMSLSLAVIGAFSLCKCIRKRKGSDSGNSTPTSAYKRVHDDQGELILRT